MDLEDFVHKKSKFKTTTRFGVPGFFLEPKPIYPTFLRFFGFLNIGSFSKTSIFEKNHVVPPYVPKFLDPFFARLAAKRSIFGVLSQNAHLWAQSKKKCFFSIFFFGCQILLILPFSQARGLILVIFWTGNFDKCWSHRAEKSQN